MVQFTNAPVAPAGVVRAGLIFVLAIALLGGCANSRLRTANLAASSNVQSLASARTVYDATLQARIDASSTQFWRARSLTPSNLRTANEQDREYRSHIGEMKAHAELLSSYFTMLAEYTAPGTNSATTHTDAQLAAASASANRIIDLNTSLKGKTLGGVAVPNLVQQGLRFALEGIADQRLRGHFLQHGPAVAEGLAIQEEVTRTVIAPQLARYRSAVCEAASGAYENAATSQRPPNNAAGFSPSEGTTFNERRRPYIMCNRDAPDALAAADALQRSRQAYVDLIEGRLSLDTAALALADAARAAELARALLD